MWNLIYAYVYEYFQVNPANERMLGGGGADGGKSFLISIYKMFNGQLIFPTFATPG